MTQPLTLLQALPTSMVSPRSTTTSRVASTSPRLSAQLSSQASLVPVGLGGVGPSKVTAPDRSYCAEPPASLLASRVYVPGCGSGIRITSGLASVAHDPTGSPSGPVSKMAQSRACGSAVAGPLAQA